MMTMDSQTPAVHIKQLKFRWPHANEDTLNIESLEIQAGEHLFIRGPSGSGKSTLLNIMSGVLNPQHGEVEILGQNLGNMSSSAKDRFRADHMGIVFQQFNLLPYLSAFENIQLALDVSVKRAQRERQYGNHQQRILQILRELGIEATTANQKASQLSIGQQQRVAVARALIGQPELVIVDEPTSALDRDNRDRFIEQLFQAAANANTTVIFVSHDEDLQSHFKRSLNLSELNQCQH